MVGYAVRRMAVLIVAVLLLLFASAPSYLSTLTREIEPVDDWATAEASVFQVLSDPELDSEPSVIISGNSSEFSSFFSHGFWGDNGVMMLHWDHTANTSLVSALREPYLGGDFICFTKSFVWPYEELPSSGYLSGDFGVEMTGDFSYMNPFDKYVYVTVWMIDPLGKWESVYRGFPPGPWFEHRVIGLQWDWSTFETVVKDDSGYQDAPNDTVTLAFGFTPSYHFFSGDSGSEPWRIYTGSMMLAVANLSLTLSVGTPLNSTEIVMPVWEQSWEGDVNGELVWPHYRGLATSDDDSTYTLSSTGYIWSQGSTDDIVLQKWNPELSRIWTKRFEDIAGYSIATCGEYIYIGGCIASEAGADACILKVAEDGSIVWESGFDLGAYSRVETLDVSPAGMIYAGTYRLNSSEDNQPAYLVKLNSNGDLLWFREIGSEPTRPLQVCTVGEDDIYTSESWPYFFTHWDSAGNTVGNASTTNLIATDHSYVYSVNQNWYPFPSSHWERWTVLTVTKSTPQEGIVWSRNITVEYWPHYKEYLEILDLEVAPDGSVLLLTYLDRFANEYRLYKINESNTEVWNGIIGVTNEGFTKSYNQVAAGLGGLAYLIGRNYLGPGKDFAVIDAYNYTDYMKPFFSSRDIPTLMLYGSVVILLIAIPLFARFGLKKEPQEGPI